MREIEIIKAVKLELGYEKYSERDLHNDYELLISDWRKRKEANIDFLANGGIYETPRINRPSVAAMGNIKRNSKRKAYNKKKKRF